MDSRYTPSVALDEIYQKDNHDEDDFRQHSCRRGRPVVEEHQHDSPTGNDDPSDLDYQDVDSDARDSVIGSDDDTDDNDHEWVNSVTAGISNNNKVSSKKTVHQKKVSRAQKDTPGLTSRPTQIRGRRRHNGVTSQTNKSRISKKQKDKTKKTHQTKSTEKLTDEEIDALIASLKKKKKENSKIKVVEISVRRVREQAERGQPVYCKILFTAYTTPIFEYTKSISKNYKGLDNDYEDLSHWVDLDDEVKRNSFGNSFKRFLKAKDKERASVTE